MRMYRLNQAVRRHLPIAPVSIMSMLLSGCSVVPGVAFNNRDNTPITSAVEREFSKAPQGLQEALLPVIWPIAGATLAVDAVVVHPALVVDDALDDTREALWDDFDWDTKYATECFTLPWRAVFTPIVFGFDWLARATLDIEPHGHKEAARSHADKMLAQAEQRLKEGEPGPVGDALDEIAVEDIGKLTQPQRARYYSLRLKAAYALGDYTWFRTADRPHRGNLRNSSIQSDLLALLEEMLTSEDAFTRLTGYRFLRAWLSAAAGEEHLRRQLGDLDPMIRFDALSPTPSHRGYAPPREYPPETLAVIERIAADDPNPVVRACAAEIVRAHEGVE